jgi:tyrosyl-tRNA synthetase
MNIIDLLRDHGRHFNVNKLLGLDSIKTRLNADGMTFTEFTYPIFQSFDFYHLYKNNNVRIQIGGSDQWGNIISGMELIHKKENSDLLSGYYSIFSKFHSGLTIPLLTTSDGKKFGKSGKILILIILEGNAVSPLKSNI